VVDEAHGTGCLGPGGRGAVAAAGLEEQVDVLVGTLGKALGTYGAYVACGGDLAALLVNSARPFIFSTAPPPAAAGAALAALAILEQEPGRPARLQANAALLRDALSAHGLDTGGSSTQILPLVVGAAEDAVAAAEGALGEGVFAQAIRPPTVPAGTSRLRVAVSSEHTPADLRAAADVLARAVRSPLPAAA